MRIGRKQAEKLGLIERVGKPGRRPLGRDLAFEALCKAHGLPAPEVEVVFCPGRRWRFDYLWGKVALEVQGAIFTGGRHVRGAALLKEYEKINTAQIMGFVVLFCTPKDLTSGVACELVKRALEARS